MLLRLHPVERGKPSDGTPPPQSVDAVHPTSSEVAPPCEVCDRDSFSSDSWESVDSGSSHSSESEVLPQSNQDTKYLDCKATPSPVGDIHTAESEASLEPSEDNLAASCEPTLQPGEGLYDVEPEATSHSVEAAKTSRDEGEDSTDSEATVKSVHDTHRDENRVSLQYVEDRHAQDHDRPIFQMLKATLQYPTSPSMKGFKLANDIVFFSTSNEKVGPPGGGSNKEIFWDIWRVIIDIARCIPEGHPWQDALLGALNRLRQREGSIMQHLKHGNVSNSVNM